MSDLRKMARDAGFNTEFDDYVIDHWQRFEKFARLINAAALAQTDHQSGMVSYAMIQARMQEEIDELRAAVFDPDWDRVKALEESLREHMAEIQRLKALAQPEQLEPYTSDVPRIMREAGMTFHLGLPHKAVVEQMTRVVDLVYAAASIKAAQQFATALAQPDESFCDSHCTRHQHHPDCFMARTEKGPEPIPGATPMTEYAAQSAAVPGRAEALKQAGYTRRPRQLQKEDEPVAWLRTENFIDPEGLWDECKTFNCEGDGTPLYTAPPQRKPLTEEQAKELCFIGPVHAPDGVVTRTPLDYRRELLASALWGLRKGESAHGIGNDYE